MKDKAKGMANEIAGKTKQVVADATDNPGLKVEGDLQETKGKVQGVAGSIKGAAGNKI
ncbi:MAG: CsbD family protein [Sandaracinobacteroides sp.]